MLTKMEKKALCVLFAVTLILLAFSFCFGILYPDAGVVSYTPDVSDKTRVSYEGVILDSKLTATGGHVILDVSGVTVFIEGGAENIYYKTGDRIHVIGVADTYAGMREIVVGPSGSITLIG